MKFSTPIPGNTISRQSTSSRNARTSNFFRSQTLQVCTYGVDKVNKVIEQRSKCQMAFSRRIRNICPFEQEPTENDFAGINNPQTPQSS